MVRNCVAKDAVVTTKFSVRFSFVLLCGELVLVVMYCVMNGFKKNQRWHRSKLCLEAFLYN